MQYNSGDEVIFAEQYPLDINFIGKICNQIYELNLINFKILFNDLIELKELNETQRIL